MKGIIGEGRYRNHIALGPCRISCRLNSNSEVTLYCNVFSTIYANNIGFQCQCHKKVRIRIPLKCTPQLAICHLLIIVTYVQYQNSIDQLVIHAPCGFTRFFFNFPISTLFINIFQKLYIGISCHSKNFNVHTLQRVIESK